MSIRSPVALVVGGGISGLVAAWELGRAGFAVEVLEASRRVGGPLLTTTVAGVRVDAGAESLLARRPEAIDLVVELGLGALLTRPVLSAPLILREDRLWPLPGGTIFGVPSDSGRLSGLLSPDEVARAEAEQAVPWTADTSVAEFVGARLGAAVVDRVVDPMLGGVYAGSAAALSAEATLPTLVAAVRDGSGLREAVAMATRPSLLRDGGGGPFVGLVGGVGGLVEVLVEAVAGEGGRIHLATPVVEIRRDGHEWLVTSRASGVREVVVHRVAAVVVATPGSVTGRLLHAVAPAATTLTGLDLADVAVVSLAFATGDAKPGFGGAPSSGVLVPAVEGRARGLMVKALTFSSAKWEWVAAHDRAVRVVRASVGRAGEHGLADLDDEQLVAVAVRDVSSLVGTVGPVLDSAVHRWPGSLPQYPVGHVSTVARLMSEVDALPGLAVAGSVLDGVGIPACIASGRAAAAKIVIDVAGRASLDEVSGHREDSR